MKPIKTIIVVYKSKDGFRWRMKRAGRIVAESGEAYKAKASMLKSLGNLIASITSANYEYKWSKS